MITGKSNTVHVSVHACSVKTCAFIYLTEEAVTDAAGQLVGLRYLVGDSFLFVQLLGQHLQLRQGELQGETVHVAFGGVLQHVLKQRHQHSSQFKPNRCFKSLSKTQMESQLNP